MQNAIVKEKRRLYYGWVVIAVAFVTMGIAVNMRSAFSIYYVAMLEDFSWSRGVTALAFSLSMAAYTVFVPFCGILMDRYGPRLIMALGSLVLAVGMGFSASISQLWHFYLFQGILVGLGSGVLTYTGHSLFLPHWFVRMRGLAIGIAFSGAGIGSILLLPFAQYLNTQLGWRTSYLILGIITAAALIPLNAIWQRHKPEDVGELPDGDSPTKASQDRGKTSQVVSNIVDKEWAATEWTLARAIKTARFWYVAVAFFLSLLTWYLLLVHQTKYIVDHGFDKLLAAYILGLGGLFGIVGQVAWGHISDRIGRETVWAVGALGQILSILFLLSIEYFPGSWPLYGMSLAQGLLAYASTPTYSAITVEIFQGKHYGTILGFISIGSGLGSSLGPWIGGVLFDLTGTYTSAFVVALVSAFLSAFFIWKASPGKIRMVAGKVAKLSKAQA